jgi:hypothetical protein
MLIRGSLILAAGLAGLASAFWLESALPLASPVIIFVTLFGIFAELCATIGAGLVVIALRKRPEREA